MASSSQTPEATVDMSIELEPLNTKSSSAHVPDEIRRSDGITTDYKNGHLPENDFNEELEGELPDKLEFRPIALREWFLWSTLAFNTLVVGLLLVITFRQNFTLLDEWAYFVIQILPLIVGTLTSTTLEAIMLALSRITPFIRCAHDDGDTMANTILKPFMPFLGIRDSIKTKNYHLFLAHILQFGGGFILGLKASLLSSAYPDISVNVTSWTLFSLFGVYCVIILYIVFIIAYLRNRKTGLRDDWDVVTMADHLTLFRHSNLKGMFEGSCIATRQSMERTLGHIRIKLRYWERKTDGARWYGFRAVDLKPKKTDESKNHELDLDAISKIRFSSSFHQMRSPWTIISLTFALVLLATFTTALSMGSSRDPRNVFHLPPTISRPLAEFAFPFLLTLVAALYSVFWEDMYILTTITQPYEAMSSQEKESSGALAEDTILLPYNGMPRYIAMFEALTRSHWKVFRVAIFALLQRILPIVVGASVTIYPTSFDANGNEEGCDVEFSTPLSIVTIVWMVVYLAVIPYEILESGYTRHLPRANITIADLLSWTCSSRLLCADYDDTSGGTPPQSVAGKAAIDDDRQQEKVNLLAGNPLDVFSKGRLSQKWFMEARLRLASEHTRFAFGLDDITAYLPEKYKPKSKPGEEKKKVYTLGIKSVDVNAGGTAATPTLSRKSEGWREGIEKAAPPPSGRDLESRGAVTPEEEIKIFRAGKPFSVIAEPETPGNKGPTAGGEAGQALGKGVGAQGGEDPTATGE